MIKFIFKKSVQILLLVFIIIGAGFFVRANNSNSLPAPMPAAYAPDFWFDSEEKYFPTNPLEFYFQNNKEIPGEKAKAKYDQFSYQEKLQHFKIFYIIKDHKDQWVYQYWLFYVFNEFDVNEHYGDWESVFVFVNKQTKKVNKIISSAHLGSDINFFLANNELNDPESEHSTILVEKGSHANWIDGNNNGLAERMTDISNWDNAYKIKDRNKADVINGPKIPHDSQYYQLQQITPDFIKNFNSEESFTKSPILGSLPFKLANKTYYLIPILGGMPSTYAWHQPRYNKPERIEPFSVKKLAGNITQTIKNTGAKTKNKLVNGWQSIIKSYKNLAQNFSPLSAVKQQAGDDQGTVLPAQESNFGLPTTITVEDLFKPKQAGGAGEQNTSPLIPLTSPQPPTSRNIAGVRSLRTSLSQGEGRGEEVGVARVIDGDTIELTTGEKVRYIGIDTPELGKPGPDDDECLAWVARLRNMQLLGTGELTLIKDPAADKDKYGRLLRYVYVGDIFINQQLVREGLAETFFCKPGWKNCPVIADKQREQIIMSAADSAKQNKRGLFSGVCRQQLVKDDNIIKDLTDNENLSQPKVGDLSVDDDLQKIIPTQQPASYIFVAGGDTTPPEQPTINQPTCQPTYLTGTENIILAGTKTADTMVILVNDSDEGVSFTDNYHWQKPVTLAQGVNDFIVIARDSAGNKSKAATISITLDTSIPASPIIFTPPHTPFYTNQLDYIISGSKEAEADILINNLTEGIVIGDDNTLWQKTVSLIAGENIFALKSRNLVGAESAEQNVSIILDSNPPITEITDKPTNPTNLSAAEFTFTADEQAVFSCKLDNDGWQDCVLSVNYTDLGAGEHIFQVQATDLAGNVELNPVEYIWEIDLTIPSAPIILWPVEFPYYASSTPIIVSGSNDSGLTVLINNFTEAETVEMINSASWQSLFVLNQGENIFYIKSIDQFGAESGQDDFIIILDTVAPAVIINSGPSSFASSTTAEFEFSADEEGISYQCQTDSQGWQSCAASTTINNLAEDEHVLEVKGADQAGNISGVVSHNWLVDLTAPTSTVANLDSEYSETGFTVNWFGSDASSTVETSGLASFDLQYKINDDWQDWINATTSTSTVFNISVDAGQTIDFRSRARDNAGNVGEWSSEAQTSIADNLADYVVISEVSLGANDAEWVELYNPTAEDIDLTNEPIYLCYFSSSKNWNEPSNPAVSKRQLSGIIPAKGFYLIRIDGAGAMPIPDYDWGYLGAASTLGNSDGSVAIFPWDPATKTTADEAEQGKIDAVGWGSVSYIKETEAITAPSSDQSLERKANQNASSTSMMSGVDQWQGNGYDTDDNSQDFIIRDSPDPQNSSSPTEPRDSAPIAPDSITDLTVQNIYTTANSVKLHWSSPDNANLGDGAYYDLRYKVKDGDCDLHLTWHNANQVATSSMLMPAESANQDQTAEITGLTAGTEYCFAIRTFNGQHWSGLSNQVSEATLSDIVNSITVDSTSSSTPCLHQQTITWPHTVSGNDTVLLVQIFWRPAITANRFISSVTYNDVPLSLAVSGGKSYLTYVYSAIYYLVSPSSGEHNIIISFPFKDGFSAASAISLNNCDIKNPINSTYFRYAGSAHIENTIIATSTNTMLVDAVAAKQGSFALTVDAGQTEFFDQIIVNYPLTDNILSGSASYKLVSNSGSHKMGWTMPNYSVWAHSIVAINVKP